MTIASDLLQRPFQTLVDDPRQWQTLIADDLDWELPYVPQSAILLGSPAGRRSSSVQDFRFFDARISAFTDPDPPSPRSRARR